MDVRDMMSDPAKVSHRVFVGSLPTDIMGKRDLEIIFESYGPIEGTLLNRGFGFVQFVNEASARDAVATNNFLYRGRKIEVKAARPMVKRGYNANQHEDRDRSPLGERDREFVDKGREPTRFPKHDRRYPMPAPQCNPERNNDCEIIVVNKNQTEYAEYIEQKLRRIGLSVDLLFPNEDVPIPRVLNNIANRGCLFAVLIMPQNEEHRSITINILHGPPQEHRNMPLEDAVALVSHSFDAYTLKDKTSRPSAVPIVAPSTFSTVSLADRHPESMQVLLNLLAENRMLTVVQYDKIISYLHNRRDLQLKVELGDAATSPPPLPSSIAATFGLDKQQTLQSRILSILNTKAAGTVPTAPAPVPAPNKPVTPLLTDSSVQKAITSLMQGDILRKLSEPR